MFIWLMPLVLCSVSLDASCPDPSLSPCGGTPCHRGSSKAGCCRDSCGKLTIISEIVQLSRIKRVEGTECDSGLDGTIQVGCSVCVCKYNRRECIYKGCKACLAIDAENNTIRYRHKDQFESGCLQCTCLDGQLDCNHTLCGSCNHRGNSTLSGQKRVFGCGTCECFDGQWTCSEDCHEGSSSSYLKALPLLLLLLLTPHFI